MHALELLICIFYFSFRSRRFRHVNDMGSEKVNFEFVIVPSYVKLEDKESKEIIKAEIREVTTEE